MKRRKLLNKIFELLDKNDSFFITGHKNPDGDTVGSELTFLLYLKKKSKKVDMIHTDRIPDNLLFLPGIKYVKKIPVFNREYDVGIIFECPEPGRMNEVVNLDKIKTIILIDHHPVVNAFGDINLIFPEASSCAEIVYEMMKSTGNEPDKDQAICLYTGLLTDTGRFQQTNTTANSFKIAYELVKKGVNPAEISKNIYGIRKENYIKMLSMVMNTLSIYGKVCIVKITHNMFKKAGIYHIETEDIMNLLYLLKDIKLYIILAEKNRNKIKVSLRSHEGSINVEKIASYFGGGGHKNASGCEIEGTVEDVKQKIIDVINSKFKILEICHG